MTTFLFEDGDSLEIRETYLAKIQKSLGSSYSPREVYETISEMRDHLNAMASADAELGLSEAVAMASAIERFGPAEKITGSFAEGRGIGFLKVTIEPRSLAKTVLVSFTFMAGVQALLILAFSRFAFFDRQILFTVASSVLEIVPSVVLVGLAAHLSLLRPSRFAVVMSLMFGGWQLARSTSTLLLPHYSFSVLPHGALLLISCAETFVTSWLVCTYAARARAAEFNRA